MGVECFQVWSAVGAAVVPLTCRCSRGLSNCLSLRTQVMSCMLCDRLGSPSWKPHTDTPYNGYSMTDRTVVPVTTLHGPATSVKVIRKKWMHRLSQRMYIARWAQVLIASAELFPRVHSVYSMR